MKEREIKIAIVGDVHDLWGDEDAIALDHLGVDLVLFVGDFGDEAVEVVAKIARLDIPKAAIFGNHDAWYSATGWGRRKRPYDPELEDWVQEQIDLLGDSYVGFGKLDLPQFNLTIVGSRPYSWGGSEWKYGDFYQARCGVDSFAASTARTIEVANSAKCDRLIIIAHNGPTGLGEEPESICGKDWGETLGGDYGDPDLASAIEHLQAQGKSIPLVAFGHMHHRLRHTKERLRETMVVHPNGTIYLNAARCPRIISKPEMTLRNFSIVTIANDRVTQAGLVWMDKDSKVAHEEIYYRVA